MTTLMTPELEAFCADFYCTLDDVRAAEGLTPTAEPNIEWGDDGAIGKTIDVESPLGYPKQK